MRDLLLTLMVCGLFGTILPRLGFFALCFGMGLTLLKGFQP